MVRVLVGDLFQSKAQTLVNTVNCVGVMGKGIALQFRKRFPDMFADYVRRCEASEVKLGRPYVFRRVVEPWILNFPTKDHWRSVARLEDIEKGLEHLVQHYRSWGVTSLAVPPLGCGEGQLEWRVVGPTLHRWLRRLEMPIDLYAPFGTPQEELQSGYLERSPQAGPAPAPPPSRVEPSWIALVSILDRIEREPYRHPVGRTTFQKIAYFATRAGIPTGFSFGRGSFGPFSEELKPAITHLVNNGLVREERLGRMFAVRPGSTFADAGRAFQADLERWHDAVERVADLFLRLDTQQAEVVATVDFATLDLTRPSRVPSESDVLQAVMAWKQRRKPPLNREQVAIAIRHLAMLGWLNVQASDDLPVSEEALVGA